MLFSQFLPIALLAAAPAAMASSQCSANVMLDQPNNDHKSTLTITSKDGTQFLAHSQGVGPFCGDKTFSTDDLEKNKNTGKGQLTASFVWKGECDKGDKNGFTGCSGGLDGQKAVKGNYHPRANGYGGSCEINFDC